MIPEFQIDYEAAQNAYEDNSDFHWNLKVGTTIVSRTIARPVVLDYGAGGGHVSLFSNLRREQTTFAYDPNLTSDFTDIPPRGNPTFWVKEIPNDQEFDLAICHFSLHHTPETPLKTIGTIAQLNPSFVVIADYDFTGSSLEDFMSQFVAQQEQIELFKLFNGNWEECFEFHSRYGLPTYKDALFQNGFSYVGVQPGEGFASNKFALIGHK